MPKKPKPKSFWSGLWKSTDNKEKPGEGESIASQINFGGSVPKKTK